MAYYRPDHDAINGEKALKELNGKNARIIKYYVSKLESRIKQLEEERDDMYKVFEGIKKYTL